jgi:uncharacterized protein YjiS (DUF1127 family)
MSHVSEIHGLMAPRTASRTATPIALLRKVLTWIERRRQRRELMGLLGMPDYMLKDIGLQRHQIAREMVKPFWRQ